MHVSIWYNSFKILKINQKVFIPSWTYPVVHKIHSSNYWEYMCDIVIYYQWQCSASIKFRTAGGVIGGDLCNAISKMKSTIHPQRI